MIINSPIISLPSFLPGKTVYQKNDNTLYYNTNGKVLLPPDLFSKLKSLSSLRKKDGANEFVLTREGDAWATRFWQLYPFLRAERDTLQRPLPCAMTDEGKLDFVNLILELFGSHSASPFTGTIKRYMDAEIVKRCKIDNKKCPNGNDPTSVADVIEIIKSLKGQADHVVFNFIFDWVSSLTMESDVGWLSKAISEYLQASNLLVELPPADSYPPLMQRDSLLRLANKKGTASTKDLVKRVSSRHFGKTLWMEDKVHKDAKMGTKEYDSYWAKLIDPLFSIVVFGNKRYVPSSRMAYPAYYLKAETDTAAHSQSSIALLHLSNAINAAPETPLADLIGMLTSAYNSQHVPSSLSTVSVIAQATSEPPTANNDTQPTITRASEHPTIPPPQLPTTYNVTAEDATSTDHAPVATMMNRSFLDNIPPPQLPIANNDNSPTSEPPTANNDTLPVTTAEDGAAPTSDARDDVDTARASEMRSDNSNEEDDDDDKESATKTKKKTKRITGAKETRGNNGKAAAVKRKDVSSAKHQQEQPKKKKPNMTTSIEKSSPVRESSSSSGKWYLYAINHPSENDKCMEEGGCNEAAVSTWRSLDGEPDWKCCFRHAEENFEEFPKDPIESAEGEHIDLKKIYVDCDKRFKCDTGTCKFRVCVPCHDKHLNVGTSKGRRGRSTSAAKETNIKCHEINGGFSFSPYTETRAEKWFTKQNLHEIPQCSLCHFYFRPSEVQLQCYPCDSLVV